MDEGRQAALKALVLRGPDLKRHGCVAWRVRDLCDVVERRFPEQLRQTSGGGPAIQLHLPEPIARLQIPYSPPGVGIRSGKDVRNSKGVKPDTDLFTQTRKGHSSV